MEDDERTSNEDEGLGKRLAVYQEMIDLSPSGSEIAAVAARGLALGLIRRYQITQDPADLQLLNELTLKALERIPDNGRSRQGFEELHVIATAQAALAQEDIPRENDTLEVIEELLPSALDSQALLLTLAQLYFSKARREISPAAIDRAIELLSQAADGAADRHLVMQLLCAAKIERFSICRDAQALSSALDLDEASPSTPNDSIGFRGVTEAIASILMQTSDRREQLIELVVTELEHRICRPELDAPRLVDYVVLLVQAYDQRYEQSGRVSDLEAATTVLRSHLAQNGLARFLRARLEDWLGNCLRKIYVETGNVACLRESVANARLSVSHGDDSPWEQFALGNLGAALRASYNHSGDLVDLEEAIDAYRRSIRQSSGGWIQGNLGMAYSNLANALRARYEAISNERDLTESIEWHEKAFEHYDPGDVDRPGRLFNLSVALRRRYQVSGQQADLDRSQELSQAAFEDCLQGSPEQGELATLIGANYLLRYRDTRDFSLLTRADEWYRRAVSLARPKTRGWGSAVGGLAAVSAARHQVNGSAADLREADRLYRASTSEDVPMQVRERASLLQEWADWTLERQAWQEAREPHRLGLELRRSMVGAQLSRRNRMALVRGMDRLAGNAALVFSKTGDFESAVTALESIQAVSLTEALELIRSDLTLVEKAHPELVSQFRKTSRRWLQLLGADGEQDENNTGVATVGASAGEIRTCRSELNDLSERLRVVSGRPGLLSAPLYAELTAAASQPLVYIVASDLSGIAFIISEHGERTATVALPELTHRAATHLAATIIAANGTRYRHLLPEVLDEVGSRLWSDVVEPLMIPLADAGEVTIIPCGVVGMLPLLAAWTTHPDTQSGRVYACDKWTMSFIANARVLLKMRAMLGEAKPKRLLAIADPQPSRAGRLPAAVAEVCSIQFEFAESVVLIAEEATRKLVTEHLISADVVHFAGHAFVNPDRPLESALILAHDDPLTLRELMDAGYFAAEAPRLGVLSACESGAISINSLEEFFSLANGFVQAGIPGVVASQWKVRDVATSLLMQRFYSLWRSSNGDPATALTEAQKWLRDTTNGEKVACLDSSPELSVGPARALLETLRRLPQNERTFANPADWAGFFYTGV
jgi:tetratricopeptide (TPR) repeat protein